MTSPEDNSPRRGRCSHRPTGRTSRKNGKRAHNVRPYGVGGGTPFLFFLPQQLRADIPETFVLAFIPQNQQAGFQLFAGFGVQDVVVTAVFVILPRGGVCVAGALVILAGGNAVTHHFRHIAVGHAHPGHGVVAVGGIVNPVFQVVLVAPLVVQPCGRVAFRLALGVVGAAGALPIFGTGPEFHGGQFAQIMGQPLPVQPAAETPLHDQHFVVMDGFIMFDGMPHGRFPLCYSIKNALLPLIVIQTPPVRKPGGGIPIILLPQ